MAGRSFTVKVPGYRGLPDLPSYAPEGQGDQSQSFADLPQQLTYAPPHDQWGMIQPLDTTSMMLQQLQAHQQHQAQAQQNALSLAGSLPGMYDAIAGNPAMQQAVSGLVSPINQAAGNALNVPYTPRNPYAAVNMPNPAGTPDVPQPDVPKASDGSNDWLAYKGKKAADAFARMVQGARPSQIGEIANRAEQEGQWAMSNHPLYQADRTRQETRARLAEDNSPEAIKAAAAKGAAETSARKGAENDFEAQHADEINARTKRRAQSEAEGRDAGSPDPADKGLTPQQYADELRKEADGLRRAAGAKGAPSTTRAFLRLTPDQQEQKARDNLTRRGLEQPNAAKPSSKEALIGAMNRIGQMLTPGN